MSRELDERVARTLGTYKAECDGSRAEHYEGWICDGCHVVQGGWGEDLAPHPLVRCYSTDYGCVPEMLAWFAGRKQNVHMSVWSNKSEPFVEAALGDDDAVPVFGATLPEALARLVVAVAEAKEAGK